MFGDGSRFGDVLNNAWMMVPWDTLVAFASPCPIDCGVSAVMLSISL